MSKKKNKKYKLYQPKKRQSKQFINKMIKRDISLYFVMVLAIIFLASTSTYAYFTTSQEKTMENVVSASVEGIDINNTNIQISDLYPASVVAATNAMYNQCKDSSGNNICFTYEFRKQF